MIAGAIVIVLAAIFFVELNAHWPYRYRNVKPLLEDVFASHITIARYHRIYFPHPGFVADGLTLRRKNAPDIPPIGTAKQLTVRGNWLDLLFFRKRVRLVDVEGLHVVLPAPGSRASKEDFPAGSSADFAGPSTIVETLEMRNAILDIQHTDGPQSSYPIHDLTIHNVHEGEAAGFVVDMQNAKPTGRIQARGSFGPLNPKNLGATPLSGEFSFSDANLGEIGQLHGTLSARGKFSHSLASIEATASSDTPNFAVARGRPARVTGQVQCTVNGLNGDIVLHTIEVHTGETTIKAGGHITGSPKTTYLEMQVTKGRAQDLMQPFMHSRAPIVGPVWLTSNARIAPAYPGTHFMQRLTVEGTFTVPAERLTNQHTETTLSAFSARAQGAGSGKGSPGNPESTDADVLSSLTGHVTIRNGVLTTQHVAFTTPGASADLNGTYAFANGAAHLTGDLRTEASLSHTATGFKSVLLKPLNPFFRRKHAGAQLPIAVTGATGHYRVSQNILHKK
jgi:hypothetical protein